MSGLLSWVVVWIDVHYGQEFESDEWTWGTGANADSFTLQIGAAAVPKPASLPLLVMGLAGLGMALRTRRV